MASPLQDNKDNSCHCLPFSVWFGLDPAYQSYFKIQHLSQATLCNTGFFILSQP
jgi:hypothetical protein